MKVTCIKYWCEPGNNEEFEKNRMYKVIEIKKTTITILDHNSTNMVEGGKHTMNYDTFHTFFMFNMKEE